MNSTFTPTRLFGPFNRAAKIYSSVLNCATYIGLATLLFMANSLKAQVPLVSWDVDGIENYGANPFAPVVNSNIQSLLGLSRGAGVNAASGGVTGGWGGTNWEATYAGAIANQSVINFGFKPKAGFAVSLLSLEPFSYRRSGTGPQDGRLEYTINGGTSYSGITQGPFYFGSSSSGGAAVVPSRTLHGDIDLQETSKEIGFRLVPFNSTDSNGDFYIYNVASGSDFSINGSVLGTTETELALDACLDFDGTAKTFEVKGDGLTVANVTITAPTSFEISLDGVSYVSSLTLSPIAGSVSETYYVRLKNGLAAGSYNEKVTVAGGGFSSGANLGVDVNGTVHALPTAFVNSISSICLGDDFPTVSIDLTGNTPFSLTYSDGTNPTGPVTTSANPYEVLSTANGEVFTATALTDAKGCVALEAGLTGNATVVVNSLPEVSVVASSGSTSSLAGVYNEGESIVLNGTIDVGSGEYSWEGPGSFTAGDNNSQTILNSNSSNAGVYTATVTNGTSCKGTATVNVVVYDNTLYVDDAGDDNNTGSESNPLATIQKAVDVSVSGGMIHVGAGTYAENIIVDKELDIRGPNYGISPNTGTRVAEAVIVPATSGSDALFTIKANDVTIDGFKLDGDNATLTSGWAGTNGADIDVYEGILYYDAANTLVVNRLKVENNIIQNVQYFGIDLFGWKNYNNPSTTGHIISNNLFKDLGTYNAGNGYDKWGGAVLLYNDNYAHVSDNVMNNVRMGVQTGNFHNENPGDLIYQTIENNNIQTRRLGVFFNLHTGPTVAPMTVSNNTITAIANSGEPKWNGMLLSSLSDAMGTVSGNIIDGSGTDAGTTTINGIEVWNVKDNGTVAISGGTISNVNTGIFLNNYDGYSTNASNGAHASISGVTIAPNANGTGIKLLDNPASTHVAVQATLGSGIVVNGGVDGLLIENAASKVVSPTGDIAFNSQTADYIKIIANANNFDATAASFDGKTGTTASKAENFTIEDKITHKMDDNALGFVSVKANNVFVTTNTLGIQQSIDVVVAGDTVNVGEGTFNESVIVDKKLSIIGSGNNSIIQSGSGNSFTLLGTASGSSVSDRSFIGSFKSTGSLSGVFVNEVVDHVTISDLNFDGNSTYGVNFGNSTGVINDWIIDNSIFNANSVGVKIATKGNVDKLKIKNSTFSNNTSEGIHAAQHNGSPGGFSNVEIIDNEFTLNGHSNNNSAIYAEKLQDAIIKGNTFTNNGTTTNSRGMILNLKYGNYSDLTISENVINETRGGTLTGGYGISIAGRNDASYAGNPASLGTVDVSKNEINGFYIGIGIDNNVDWNSSSVTNNKVHNSAVALSATGANTGLSLTVNQNDFSGSSGYALYNGVSGSSFDATCNWFGTTEAATVNTQVSGDVAFLPFATNGTDDNLISLGFQPVAGSCEGVGPVRLYSDNTLASPLSSYFNIQDAVDAASSGNAIVVAAGTYNESVNVNKSLTIQGPNADISPNTGSRVNEAVLSNISSGRAFSISNGNTDVIISGFKFDGGSPIHDGNDTGNPRTSDVTFSKNLVINANAIYAGTSTSWADLLINDNKFEDVNATATSSAMQVSHTLTTTILDNTFTNVNYAAMVIDATPTVTISGNIIDGTGYQGIQIAGTTGDATILNNKINDANRVAQATDRGAIRLYGSGFTGVVTISNNEITGGYNGITIKDGEDITGKNISISENSITGLASGKAIYHGGTGELSATCNWFGTTEPQTINGQITGDVNFLPFGSDGTDDDVVTLGFQPVVGSCNGYGPVIVYEGSTPTVRSSHMTIQAAIDDSDTENGDVITVAAGTYSENVVVNKEVVIQGANVDTDCSGSRNPESIVSVASGLPFNITADNVVINGFEITAPASSNAVVIGKVSNASVMYNNIHDVGTSFTGGNIHAVIYTVGSTNNSDINISDNCINDISSTSLTGYSSSAIGVLQSTSTGVLTGLDIKRNIISNVTVNDGGWPTGKIAYGIQINVGGNSNYLTNTGKVVNASISNNEISNISGFVATAIGLEGNTEDAIVTGNKVSNLTSTKSSDRAGGGYDLNGLKFENNAFVSTVTIENNSFETTSFTNVSTSNLGYGVVNYVLGTTAALGCNWFGTAVYNEIEDNGITGKVLSKATANIVFSPYLTDGGDGAGIGFQPTGDCSGSPLVITSAVASPELCETKGSIEVTFSGGVAPHTLSWGGVGNIVTALNTATITGLDAGTYTVTITDDNGSSVTTTTEVLYHPVVNVTSSASYASIQDAVDGASDSDEIEVCEGTYNESLIVPIALSLVGPNAGTSGCDSRGTEATINGYIKVTSSDVSINGFRLLDGANAPAGELAAVHIVSALSNVSIMNNYIERTGVLDFDVSRGVVNEIGGTTNLTVSNNYFTGWHTGTYLQNADADVTNNCYVLNEVGISSDTPIDVLVDGNDILNNAFEGVGIGGTVGQMTISNNNITGNLDGVHNYSSSEVNAGSNWWGDAAGPSDFGSGSGDKVNANVNFCPLLNDEVGVGTAVDCRVLNVSNGESFVSIQAAIDDAGTSNGDTLVAESGTYSENVVVNKEVVIQGANVDTDCSGSRNPESIISVASGLPFNITADNVVINGFEITAPASSNAVVIGKVSNASVMYNNIHDVGTSFTGGNIHAVIYTVGSANNSDINISDNCINDISSTSLTGFSSSAIGVLQSTSTGVLTGLDIKRNIISNVTVNDGGWPTGKIAYGIQINVGGNSNYLTNTGKVVNASISNNEISNISGFVATAIGLEGNTEDAVVTGNKVSNLTSTKSSDRAGGGYDLNGLKFENNAFVSTVTIENNSFETTSFTNVSTSNLGYGVVNYVPGTTATLGCNWFGTAVYNEIEDNGITGKVLSKATANIVFSPYLTDGGDGAGIGFQPTGDCSGSPLVITSAIAGPTVCATKGLINVTFSGGAAPFDFSWTGGGSASDVTSPYSITELDAGTYTVTVSDNNGSSATATVEVILYPIPEVPIIETDNSELCKGESAVLTATCSSSTDIFRWTTPGVNEGNGVSSLTNTGALTVQKAGTYSGYCETINGCTSEVASVVINEKSNCGSGAFISITPELPAICPGGSIDLTASGCTGTLTWYTDGASPVTGYTATLSPAVTTSYFVSCSSGGSTTVDVKVAEQNLMETGKVTTGMLRMKASETIESTKKIGDANFTPAPNVIYEAGNSIVLMPGFSTEHSTVFKAEIKVCD